MAAVLRPNGASTHTTGAATPSGAQESPQAQKTAELLAAWHSLAPTIRDQPVSLHQPIPAASAPHKTGLAASDSSAAVDPSQAAQRVQALLEEWRSSAGMEQEPTAAQLSWNERLQHQMSKQQGEDLLAKVTSLEYGR
ncbi:g3778 [Coccomyxa elongata]